MSPVKLTSPYDVFLFSSQEDKNTVEVFLSPQSLAFEQPSFNFSPSHISEQNRLAQTARRFAHAGPNSLVMNNAEMRFLKAQLPRNFLNPQQWSSLMSLINCFSTQHFEEMAMNDLSASALRDLVLQLSQQISAQLPSLTSRATRLIFALLLEREQNRWNNLLSQRNTYLNGNISTLEHSDEFFRNTQSLGVILNRHTKILEAAALLGIEDLIRFDSSVERSAAQIFSSTLSFWSGSNSCVTADPLVFPFQTTDPNVVPVGSENIEFDVSNQGYSELPLDIQQQFRQQALLGINVLRLTQSHLLGQRDRLETLIAYEFFVISHPAERRMNEHTREKYMYLARQFLNDRLGRS